MDPETFTAIYKDVRDIAKNYDGQFTSGDWYLIKKDVENIIKKTGGRTIREVYELFAGTVPYFARQHGVSFDEVGYLKKIQPEIV